MTKKIGRLLPSGQYFISAKELSKILKVKELRIGNCGVFVADPRKSEINRLRKKDIGRLLQSGDYFVSRLSIERLLGVEEGKINMGQFGVFIDYSQEKTLPHQKALKYAIGRK